MKCFIGIDAGTSGIKVAVFDALGNVRGTGYHECDVITPRPGWGEQDPRELWRACSAAVKMAIGSAGAAIEVGGIGFSGQMQGCLLVDRNLEPIGNCIIWLDQRSSAQVDEICGLITDDEALHLTSNHCLNSFWAPKLFWIRENRPEDYERAYKVMFVKDYLRLCMTGEIATEVSDASLSFMLDVAARKWSYPVFDRLGIDRSLVPDTLAEAYEVVGRLRCSVAEEWGIAPGVPVAAGAGDQPAGGVGTGIVRPGVLGSTIGTSGVVFGCTSSPLIDAQNRAIMSMAHSAENKWCFLGLVLSAGGAFKWLRDTVFPMQKEACAKNGTDIYDYMTSLAAQAQPGCEGLTFLPYLNGEKTPISDENARGVLFGLSYRHGINEIARSVMEGISFAMRDSVEICREMGHSVTEIRANGGGAKSELWLQMQADIYKSQVVTMNVEEGPAAGAAILAAVGAGHFAAVEEGCDAWLKVTRTIEPDMHNAAIYDECYARYKALYPALRESFRLQAELVDRLA